MRTETMILNEKRNVTLTAYIQETGGAFRYVEKRPAVFILPGGAYQYCSDREADPVAMPYLKAGYQAFILRYSVEKDAVWPNPLEDYEQAMELIRSRSEEWKVYTDKIAVIGFSAGGHLAAAAATMSKNRPNAAILGYAVTGSDVKACNPSAPDTIAAVDSNTCPCFLFSSRTDNVVPVENTVRFMDALVKADVAFESHIYSFGPHGFSTCDTSIQPRDTKQCARIPNWVEDSIGWLKDMFGDFGDGCMTEPECRAHVTGNYEKYLSVDCTMGYLMEKPEAMEIIGEIYQKIASQEGAPSVEGEMGGYIRRMRLRDVLGYGNVPQEQVTALDEQLKKIKNDIISRNPE